MVGLEREVSWKVTRETNPTGDWEYKVITKGWRLSLQERRQRKVLARTCCYARTLERIFGKSAKAKNRIEISRRWMPEITTAIEGLIRLQDFSQSRKYLLTPESEKEPEIEPLAEERRLSPQSEENTRRLYDLWTEFAYSERIRAGFYDRMSNSEKGKCHCGKGRISYPHWPPTSIGESKEQFKLCLDDDNTHRRNLVIHWWRHFNDLATMTEWKVSEKQQRYRDAETMIRENSEIVQQELERSTITRRKRPKGWSCPQYCEPTLREKRCSCLCHCEDHRDLCPVHS